MRYYSVCLSYMLQRIVTLVVAFALSKVLIVIFIWRKKREWGYDGRHMWSGSSICTARNAAWRREGGGGGGGKYTSCGKLYTPYKAVTHWCDA